MPAGEDALAAVVAGIVEHVEQGAEFCVRGGVGIANRTHCFPGLVREWLEMAWRLPHR